MTNKDEKLADLLTDETRLAELTAKVLAVLDRELGDDGAGSLHVYALCHALSCCAVSIGGLDRASRAEAAVSALLMARVCMDRSLRSAESVAQE